MHIRLRTILWVVWFAAASGGLSTLHAQWDPDPEVDSRIQEGIDHLYNLEFYDANKLFDEVVALRPRHPVGYFFRAMVQWWRILSNFDDESQDDRFYEMLGSVIKMCDARLEKNPDDVTALFFKGGSLGFRGRLRANRGDWFGAAKDGIAALPIVRKAYALDPKNYDVLLGIGIYNYYAEIIPQEYPIVKPFMIFLPSGDRKKGIEQLQQAAEHSKYARTEAKYFLMQDYFLYEKDYPKALELAQSLSGKYPRNPLFLRYLGRCYVSVGKWDDAARVFTDVLGHCAAHHVGYDRYDEREAHYYLAKDLFIKGKWDESLRQFQKCVDLSQALDKDEASGFMSMATLSIGRIYDIQQRRNDALAQYRKVLSMKKFESTHQDAQRFIDHPYAVIKR